MFSISEKLHKHNLTNIKISLKFWKQSINIISVWENPGHISYNRLTINTDVLYQAAWARIKIWIRTPVMIFLSSKKQTWSNQDTKNQEITFEAILFQALTNTSCFCFFVCLFFPSLIVKLIERIVCIKVSNSPPPIFS